MVAVLFLAGLQLAPSTTGMVLPHASLLLMLLDVFEMISLLTVAAYVCRCLHALPSTQQQKHVQYTAAAA
jgi:hypothetical protein